MSYKTKKNLSRRGLSVYQYGLLNPSIINSIKTPATYGKRTIPLKKFWSITRNTNNSGNILLHFMPGEIMDSTCDGAASIICNNVGYQPANATTALPVEYLDQRPLWNLTTNTAKQVRLVSLSATMTSLSTSLNRKGTIYGACLEASVLGTALFTSVANQNCVGIPAIQNGLFKRANVSDGQGICVAHIPSDDDDHSLLPPMSASIAGTVQGGTMQVRHPNSEDFRGIVLIGQSLEVSSPVRFDFHAHYEIVPVPEQSLAGFETTAFADKVLPAIQIQEIMNNHRDRIIKVIGSFEGGTDNTLGLKNPVEIRQNNVARNYNSNNTKKGGKNNNNNKIKDQLNQLQTSIEFSKALDSFQSDPKSNRISRLTPNDSNTSFASAVKALTYLNPLAAGISALSGSTGKRNLTSKLNKSAITKKG